MKVIITGATGMVGKGVLLECLSNDTVTEILVINRKPVELTHPKLKEIIHKDFFDLSPVREELSGYDACFFCLGITSFRQSEANYSRITYDLTMRFAQSILPLNPAMTFIYVSGTGTDSTEQGRTMWARVKGKTENAILALGFKDAYAFRPAYIKPEADAPSSTRIYRILLSTLGVLHPVIKFLLPKYTTTTKQIALAMIEVTENGFEKPQVESIDIVNLSKLR
ncbi:MAG: NAD-dependent epimerase/dehydratase family protein [Bacteroidota bacterium]